MRNQEPNKQDYSNGYYSIVTGLKYCIGCGEDHCLELKNNGKYDPANWVLPLKAIAKCSKCGNYTNSLL